ncbi:MAG: hypothetical protein E7550_00545 [Ruminococcaceae bacterium]|nr:hypothetical protein [Oscillospiraceae bacterium]
MKPTKPSFWVAISTLSSITVFVVVLVYNIDVSEMENSLFCLMLLPIYLPLVIAYNLHYKDDDSGDYVWAIKFALIASAFIIYVFKVILSHVG